MHQTTPIRVPRTSGLRRIDSGLGRNCFGPFRSPQRLFPRTELPDDSSEESLKADIQKLKEKQDMLDKEISQLVKEGYCVIELEDHIALLHEYNDVKDVAQMLLGKLGESQGVGRWLLPSQGPLTCWPSHSCQLPCSCSTPILLFTSLHSPWDPAKQVCSSCFHPQNLKHRAYLGASLNRT
ncbi:DNA repair protein SWI5 homolog [Lemmus lemmus]